jgi:tRNA dimethylallyltransferase
LRKIFSIFGPTGIGKSSLSIKLAKKINGEIIGVDSRQIYDGISIGTAQPSKKQLDEIPHHLIGFKKLNEKISSGEYLQLIDSKIEDIFSRGKSPILCGGTGLYFKSLIEGIFEGSHTNIEIRKKLEADYKKDKVKLYNKLKKIDPKYSEKVHINNKKRLVRALEIFETTGIPLSENFSLSARKSKYVENYFFVYLNANNSFLHPRIEERLIEMFDNGMIEEVEFIVNEHIDISHIDYIGFREIKEYLENKISIDEAMEKIFIRTRQYAKRQNKWFSSNKYDLSFNIEKNTSNDIVDKLTQIN